MCPARLFLFVLILPPFSASTLITTAEAQSSYTDEPLGWADSALEEVLERVPEDDVKERRFVTWAYSSAPSSLVDKACFARRFHERRTPSPGESVELNRMLPSTQGRIVGLFLYNQHEAWADCIDPERFAEATRRRVYKQSLNEFARRHLGPLEACAQAALIARSAKHAASRTGRPIQLPDTASHPCLSGADETTDLTADGIALLQAAQEQPLPEVFEARPRSYVSESATLAARLAHESAFRDEIARYDAFVACVVNRFAPAYLERVTTAGASVDAGDREFTQAFSACHSEHPWR